MEYILLNSTIFKVAGSYTFPELFPLSFFTFKQTFTKFGVPSLYSPTCLPNHLRADASDAPIFFPILSHFSLFPDFGQSEYGSFLI